MKSEEMRNEVYFRNRGGPRDIAGLQISSAPASMPNGQRWWVQQDMEGNIYPNPVLSIPVPNILLSLAGTT